MGPKKGSVKSHTHHEKATQGATTAKVERFCPRLDIPLATSKLSREEMDRSSEVKEGEVDLDPQNPERSAWLAHSFMELGSQDFDKRFFALYRIEQVLRGVVLTETPEVSAGFSAHLLEHGILNNIILLLKAAKTRGDCYLVSGKLGDRKEKLLVEKEGLLVFCKIQTCCDLLQSLLTDARTVRFVRKSIPDLIGILEGIYLAREPVCMIRGRDGRPEDIGFSFFACWEKDRHSALSALGYLVMWSTPQDRSLVASREELFRQAMMDATDGSDFAQLIINRLITLSSHVVLQPEYPASLFEDFLKLAFKAMEISDSANIVTMAFGLISNLLVHKKVTSKQLTDPNFLPPLLAMAACPMIDEKVQPNLHTVIGMIGVSFRPIIESEDPTSGFLRWAAANDPKVLARMKELSKLHAANQKAACGSAEYSEKLDNLQERFVGAERIITATKEELFYEISVEDLESQRRPCRKCSRSSCPNTESAPRQFRLCSNCRLAIYCSRECQKLAWKEGHRNRCQSGSDHGRVKARERVAG